MCLDNTTLPARLVTRNRLRPRHHGLIPMHLVRCLFLLSLLCVAYSCAVVDKKDHTTGAIQNPIAIMKKSAKNCTLYHIVNKSVWDDIGAASTSSTNILVLWTSWHRILVLLVLAAPISKDTQTFYNLKSRKKSCPKKVVFIFCRNFAGGCIAPVV